MVRLPRLLAWIGILWLFSCGTLTEASGAELHLSITLEDSVFLEGQSVYAFFCARNVTLRTVLEPDIRIEEFRARLSRTDTGEVLKSRISGDDIFGMLRGLTLRQGEARCYYVLDLAKFGVQSPDSVNLSGRQHDLSLEPGSYVLNWEYRYRPHPGNDLLKGEARFTVHPLTSDPRELSLVRSFLAGREGPLPPYARQRLPEFYRSKFLLRVYLYTGPLIDELNFAEIFEEVVRAGAPAQRRAALLALRLSMTDRRDQFSSHWRGQMLKKVESQVERDALSIVPRRSW